MSLPICGDSSLISPDIISFSAVASCEFEGALYLTENLCYTFKIGEFRNNESKQETEQKYNNSLTV